MRSFSSKVIEHTLLGSTVNEKDVERMLNERRKYKFGKLVLPQVYSCLVGLKAGVPNVTVVNFPFGNNKTPIEVFDEIRRVSSFADEVDVVINIALLKEKKDRELSIDIQSFVLAARPMVIKIIIQTPLLSENEIERVSCMCVNAGAHFIKTSTGYEKEGNSQLWKSVNTIKNIVGSSIQIKASGGIDTLSECESLLSQGADTIGTSHGVAIMKELEVVEA